MGEAGREREAVPERVSQVTCSFILQGWGLNRVIINKESITLKGKLGYY